MPSFDISQNDRTHRRKIGWVAKGALLAMAVFLVVMGYLFASARPGRLDGLIMGVALLLLGGSSFVGAVLTSSKPVSRLEVSREGFELWGGGQTRCAVSWKALESAITVFDYRERPEWASIPCVLSHGWRSYGVSPEGMASVIASARAAGSRVEEKRFKPDRNGTTAKATIKAR